MHTSVFVCWYEWWRHQMETFSAPLAICARNSSATGEFPSQMPVTQSFDVFLDLRPNKRLSKLPWFETPSGSVWRQRNDQFFLLICFSPHELMLVKALSTHRGWEKMAAISQAIFSSLFSCMKIFVFWLQYRWELPQRVQLTKHSIGSDNRLAPNRRQAIIGSNDGLFYWRIYASLGLDELKTVNYDIQYFCHTLWANTLMLTVIPSKRYKDEAHCKRPSSYNMIIATSIIQHVHTPDLSCK